jgi:glycosyltransferase involved in cell wall biosynthesis
LLKRGELLRVAVVHHWFVTRGGGERVAECIAALFPQAEIFTLVAGPAGLPATLAGRTIHTSFLQRLPLARSHHRHFMPLYPAATERLDLRGFDLVLSSDSGPVKGVRLSPGAVQICYCHSPMRYLWDGYEAYREGMRGLTRAAFTVTAGRVRRWDAAAAKNVSFFLANSHYVADRIRRCYGREAEVLPPPIDLHRAAGVLHRASDGAAAAVGEHYLCAGRLVAYKRTEILIEACQRLGRRLHIAGTGPEEARLRKMTEGDSRIEFLGELSDEALWREYASCRALLFAADEDFGMVPLEAQACGRPVIAYGVGGSLETVRGVWSSGDSAAADEITGMYFEEQTAEAVGETMRRWEREFEARFRPEEARRWASGFATPIFLERYREAVLRHVPEAEAACVPAAQAAATVCG